MMLYGRFLVRLVAFSVGQMHVDIKADFRLNGLLSDEIAVDNEVKQGDILTSIRFLVYFAIFFPGL